MTNLTNQKSIRAAFWEEHPEHEEEARKRGTFCKGQNAQTTDCCCAWCDFVETLRRDGRITESLADRATL